METPISLPIRNKHRVQVLILRIKWLSVDHSQHSLKTPPSQGFLLSHYEFHPNLTLISTQPNPNPNPQSPLLTCIMAILWNLLVPWVKR